MSDISTNSPIDAVITWVNGNNPVHKAKQMEALKKKPGRGDMPIATGRDDALQLLGRRIQGLRIPALWSEK